jgi:nitrile hydratase beta subunit
MDGAHDLGGMHGFGPIERDEASIHADWERRVLGIERLLRSRGQFSGDEKRHAIERMGNEDYLRATYFERWLAAVETLLEEQDVLTAEEVAERAAAVADGRVDALDGTDAATDDSPRGSGSEGPETDPAAAFREAFEAPASFDRPTEESRFAVGDVVTVRSDVSAGHTRCPRYLRRAEGAVERVYGAHALPDASARGEDRGEPLYGVAFDATALWGADHEGPSRVHVDLWESYLEDA